jgi:hypothetical protein
MWTKNVEQKRGTKMWTKGVCAACTMVGRKPPMKVAHKKQTMKIELSFFALLSLGNLAHGADIKICVNTRELGVDTTLPGANVKCWDEDPAQDDEMTETATTGLDGCVTLTYTKQTPKWYNPCAAWDCSPGFTDPDIYCVVTKDNMYPVRTCNQIPLVS